MLFAGSRESPNVTSLRFLGNVRPSVRSSLSLIAVGLRPAFAVAAVVGLLVVGNGCNRSPSPAASSTSPVSAPTAETTTGAEAVAPDATVKPSEQPSNEVAPKKNEKAEKTEVIPAELVNLAAEIRPAAVALSKLGGEIEVGVGEKVISVDLDGKEVRDADLVHVAALTELKSLNLSNTAITDAGLAQLLSLKKLKFLYLFGTKVTDSGAASIAAFPRLEVLCLDQTEISDIGLKTLEDLPRLEKLHVHSKAKITDAGLESLKKHTRLFELRIGGPGLSEKAIDALKAALPDCNVVYDPDTEAKPE